MRKWFAYLWILLIFSLSSIPNLKLREEYPANTDKVFHFIEYGIMSALLYSAYGKFIIWQLLIPPADEFYQGFIPGRKRDISDLLSDYVGIILMSGVYGFLRIKDKGKRIKGKG